MTITELAQCRTDQAAARCQQSPSRPGFRQVEALRPCRCSVAGIPKNRCRSTVAEPDLGEG